MRLYWRLCLINVIEWKHAVDKSLFLRLISHTGFIEHITMYGCPRESLLEKHEVD